jgi:tetratricopeptide (TPR) repeat protein
MGVVFAGIAMALHPDALGVRTWVLPFEPPDQVSLDYLAIELARRPDDVALRRAFARQLEQVGELEQAAEVARPLLELAGDDPESWDLVVRIELARTRAAGGDARPRLEARLAELLGRARSAPLEPARRVRFAEAAQEIGQPGLAARYLDGARGALERLTRLERSARLYMEAGDRDRAAERWLEVARLELAGDAAPDRLARAVAALEAAGRVAAARGVLVDWLRRAPGARAALDPAIRLAWAAGDLDRAFALSSRRARGFSEDPRVLRDHVEIALARGAPADGLAAARRLEAIRPGDRAARALHARVAEWSGLGDEALRVWWSLAREGDRAARAEAERLARGLGEERVLLAILSERLARGARGPELVEQVVFLAEALGEPERARAVLVKAAARRGAPKRLSTRLARLEARMGLLSTAAARWAEIDRRFGTTPREAVTWAGLLWRAIGPKAALDALKDRDLDDAEVAERVAELAWQVGARGLAVRAHRALAAAGRLEPYQALRLARVLESEGRLGEALDAVESALREAPSVELLLRGLELAVQRARPREALALLELAPEAEAEARALPAYWRLRAQIAVGLERPGAARRALEKVVELDPGSDRAAADLLWLLVRLDDRAGIARWIRALAPQADAASGLYPVLAAALAHLGRDAEALRYYALEAGERPEDWRFWLDYADTLERVGRRDAALRMRRYGLRKVPEDAPLGRLLMGAGILGDAERALAARRLARDPEAPRPARRAAAGVLLEAGAPARARRGLEALGPLAQSAGVLWHDARLGVALAERDRAAVARLLAASPEGASPALEAEAHAFLGRYDAALALALRSRVDGRGAVTRAALLRYLAAETRRRPQEARGGGGYDRLGDLERVFGRAACQLSDGPWSARVVGGYAWLEDRPGRAIGGGVDGEGWLALALERRWRRGELTVEAGGHAQVGGGPVVPRLRVRARHALDARFEVWARATAFEVVPETPLLLTLGVRERVGVGAAIELPGGLRLRASIDGEHHHDRGGATLGLGAVGDLRLSRGLDLGGSNRLEVYASGRALARSAAETFGPELSPLDARGLTPADILPTEFATAGLGVAIGRGDLAAVPNPALGLRYFVDAWAGWQWPLDQPAYRVEAGLGARLFGPDELHLRGYFGNVLGGLEDVQAGLTLGYRWRL